MDEPTFEFLQTLEGKRAIITTRANIVYHGKVLKVTQGAVILGMGKYNSPEAIAIAGISKAYNGEVKQS